METKKFICKNFQPNPSCDYEIEGPEDEVVENAANHLIFNHHYEDTPKLRDDIRASLI
jgi:predicted small metal-binding protein